MTPKQHFDRILDRSFNQSWSNIKEFSFNLELYNHDFPVSGKLTVYGKIKNNSRTLLINSKFNKLDNADSIDSWFSLELANMLKNHRKWTK